MKDYVIRAVAAGGEVRAFACTTRNLVEEARLHHDSLPVATAALGRLLSAGSMMGIMMKGEEDKLTLQIKGDGPIGGVVVTADSKARVKGYVLNPEVDIPLKAEGKLDVGKAIGNGELTIIRDLGLKEPYVGRTSLITGEIAEDLTYYFASSEQVPSVVALGVLVDRDYSVRRAGGFIIQLMPGAGDETIDAIEKKIPMVTSVTQMLDEDMTPEEILTFILEDLGIEITDKVETSFLCDCNKERVEQVLLSIGEKELRGLYEEAKPVELCCQFCGKKYEFMPEEIGELLKSGK
ncbi:MAG: Hsp33 family molecular chaperone HslO [Catonella sp.]|uniref:Hsp33 family molecular chaperone HslO n=1 Tax=Catonella sp. TaxID=2382125 RepID=UPI003FA04F65